MSFRLTCLVFSAFFCCVSPGWSEERELLAPYSLDECYRLTLRQSEALRISAEDLRVAEAQYYQSLSRLYPQIDIFGQQRFRNSAGFGRLARSNSSEEDQSSGGGSSGGSVGRSQLEGGLGLSQPIFHGFREQLLSTAAELELEAQGRTHARSAELLFGDVAGVFYQLSLKRDALGLLKQSRETLLARVKELKDFAALGKARDSEVLAAQSDLADLEAQLRANEGELQAHHEILAFLTGVKAGALKLEPVKTSPKLESLDFYIERSATRPDIQAAKLALEAAEKELKASYRERWPSVDLNSKAYLVDDPDRTRAWDLSLDLSVPVFDGGAISARQSETQARQNQSALAMRRLLRLAERDVRVAYAQAQSSLAESGSLNQLVLAAQRNYEVQRHDYTLGVVTNLDVLQAITRLQDAKLRSASAKYTYLMHLAELELASAGVQP